MAITLDATTKSLELATDSTGSIDWAVSWVDATTTSFTPGDNQGNVTTATTTTIVAAPAASTQRGIKSIQVYNKASTAQTVTIKKDVGGTEYSLFKATMTTGESLAWSDGADWMVYDNQGRIKTATTEVEATTTRSITFYKSGTAADAASYWYSFWKDTGFPGAWSPGTPGTGGRNTSGTNTADAGCLPLWTPTGNLYITENSIGAGLSIGAFMLADVLWVNTGLSVTTTTAQTVTMPGALPARDQNGTTSGVGCIIGIVTTTANTNASPISNSTISYTNSDGTSGRTATLIGQVGEQFPASPVIGNVVWFGLAAGDKGVQSIQSVTLGTSLGGGAISVIIARPILFAGTPTINTQFVNDYAHPGIQIYADSCLHWFVRASGTTANVITGNILVTER